MKSTSPLRTQHVTQSEFIKKLTLNDDVVVDLVLPVHVLDAARVLALVALCQPVHT